MVVHTAKALTMDQLQKASNNSAPESQLHPNSQMKAIVLSDNHPDKTALIKANLDSA